MKCGLVTAVLLVVGPLLHAQAPIEFDVASIKVHAPDPSSNFTSSLRTLPNGQVVMTNISRRCSPRSRNSSD